jgi:hypothetical protein
MSTSSKAQRLRGRMPAIDPDAPPPPQPATTAPHVAAVPPLAPEASEPAPRSPAAVAAAPARSAEPVGERVQHTALDDPGILAGRMGYRSFYVEDSVFARFRAAIYWLSRREDVEDVPENMSVAVQEWMESTAADLERRYNDGEVFRMPPPPKKRRTKSGQ